MAFVVPISLRTAHEEVIWLRLTDSSMIVSTYSILYRRAYFLGYTYTLWGWSWLFSLYFDDRKEIFLKYSFRSLPDMILKQLKQTLQLFEVMNHNRISWKVVQQWSFSIAFDKVLQSYGSKHVVIWLNVIHRLSYIVDFSKLLLSNLLRWGSVY